MEVLRTNSENVDFIALVKLLDAYLKELDEEDHTFYAQFNKIETLKYVVLVYENGVSVGCGGMKEVEPEAVEIKRMFVLLSRRGKGVGKKVLSELEKWAVELLYKKSVLETGKRQPDAIALYTKHGYYAIPNYGQYVGVENSACFEKRLSN